MLLQHTAAYTYAHADIASDIAAARQTCIRLYIGRGSPVAALYDIKHGQVQRMKVFEVETWCVYSREAVAVSTPESVFYLNPISAPQA